MRNSCAGAENQAFLVEAVSGAETLKAMAIEPQMQRRWEEQLAAYIRASFNTQTLGNFASQAVQFINKGTIVLTLYFGAKAVIDGSLTVGELVAFNMLSAPCRRAGAAHRPDLAGFPADPNLGGAAGRYPEYAARDGASAAPPRYPRSRARSGSSMSPSAIASTGRRC